MLDRFRERLRPHARSLGVVAGMAGGLYLAGSYVLDRLKDMQTKLTEERAARESLRRRFLQNQEDCTFTLMTMLPALSTQIREEMDVEDIVHQLQQTAKPTTSPSSTTGVAMGDSIVSLAGSEATSTESSSENNGSSSSLGAPAPAATSSGEEADAEVEGAKTGQLNVGASKGSSRGVGESWSSEFQEMERDKMTTSQQLEASVVSIASTDASTSSADVPPPVEPAPLPSAASSTLLPPPKTKVQLWNELKLLAFTRTITVLYTLTLLTLQTRIQLNLLGRHSYVRSVKELEKTFASPTASDGASASGSWWGLGDAPGESGARVEEGEVSPETEMVYLSFSWWLTTVGWREVKERVQNAVAEVMGPLSVKKILTQADFESLLLEVRRRVEFDLGGDSIPRPHPFLPHLLPQTPAGLSQLLIGAHLNPLPSSPSAPIQALLSETSTYLSSPSFESCLSNSLALAFGTLVDALVDKSMLAGVPEWPVGADGATRIEEVVESKGKRLAEVLVEVAKFGKETLEEGTMGGGNRVVDSLADLPELASFSAVVYSSYLGLEDAP